jgi:hypothetical protein
MFSMQLLQHSQQSKRLRDERYQAWTVCHRGLTRSGAYTAPYQLLLTDVTDDV